MRPYKLSTPRAAFGIAAVAMTAITFGLTVVVPAEMDSSSQEARTLAEPAAATLASAAVVVDPPCVDADVRREPKLDSGLVRNSRPKRKQQD